MKKTFKELCGDYEAKFRLSKDDVDLLKNGKEIKKHYYCGVGVFPYILKGINKDLEIVGNETKAFELSTLELPDMREAVSLGYCID